MPVNGSGIETIGWADRLPVILALLAAIGLPAGLWLYLRRADRPPAAKPQPEPEPSQSAPAEELAAAPQEQAPAPAPLPAPRPAPLPAPRPAPAPAPAPASGPGLLAGKYARKKLLGSGAGFELWEATDQSQGRDVNVRILHFPTPADAKRRASVLKEAQTLAGLRHPVIQSMLDVVEGRSSLYLVIEPAEGRTLAQLLRGGGKLSLSRACQLFVGVCDALESAHTAGIFHGSLSPANLLVTDKDRVTVVGFGSWNGGRPPNEGAPSQASDIRALASCLRDALGPNRHPRAQDLIMAAFDSSGLGIMSMAEFKAKLSGLRDADEN